LCIEAWPSSTNGKDRHWHARRRLFLSPTHRVDALPREMTMLNGSPDVDISPVEQWLGIRSAPNVITGAPSATRQRRSTYSGGGGEGRDVNEEPAAPRSHHAGGRRERE
jgi:hypothetical protein